MAYYPIDKNPSGLLFVGDPGANSLLASVTNVVYDSGQGFLGVNVAQPEFALDVSGTGSFEGVRFSDGSLQTTAASSASDLLTVSGIAQSATDDLATASGHLQSQVSANDSDISTVSGIAQSATDDLASASGHLQTQITSNDSDISALQTATGNLDTRVTANDSDINTVSGIAQSATDDLASASGHLQTQITSNDSDINTVSGIAQSATDDLASASGHLQTQITSNDSDISALQAATGVLRTDVDSNDVDINVVSGIAQSATDDLATASGHLQTQITSNDADILTVSGLIGIPGGDDKSIQFNNAGSFSGEPKFTWDYDADRLTVSGSALFSDTGTVLEVTNTNGTSLFSVKDSDEAQVIVAAHAGQTGMPFEVKDSFGANVAYVDIAGNISGNHLLFGDGTLQTTAAGSASDLLLVSGIAQEASDDLATASGHLQTQITSNDSDISTVSGIAQSATDDLASASGHLQTQITSNDSDISALQTATGVLRTDVDSNDVDINIVSGIAQSATDDLATASGHLQTQITSNDSDISTVSGIAQSATDDLASASGHLQTQITSNDSDISALQTATGVLRTDVDSNDVDINIVSGIAQGAADDVVTASGHLQNQISFRTVQTNPAPVGELTFDVNMLSGSLETYTLPTVTSNAGKIVRVKKTDQVVNRPVTISGNAVGQLIDELNLYTLYNQHEAVTLICDGSNWQVF